MRKDGNNENSLSNTKNLNVTNQLSAAVVVRQVDDGWKWKEDEHFYHEVQILLLK